MNFLARLARNAGLAAGTALEHLGEDPAVLALQVSRLLPARAVRPAARALRRVSVAGPSAALAAHVLGDREGTVRLLEGIRGHHASRARLRAADVALAAHLPDLADQLLFSVGRNVGGRAETAARRDWYHGAMSTALAALESEPGARAARTYRRLASEHGTFTSVRPVLSPVASYQPRRDAVLHLLTNSLPHTESGYAQRTHSLLSAQRSLGLDVHAVTRLGYPVQVGRLLARDADVVDGVTYHRLLDRTLPEGMSARLQEQAERVLRLALQIRPEVLHTTTHFVNGLVTQAVAEALGVPWVYEVRGQLADTWAGSRPVDVRASERYRLFKEREAEVTAAASAVFTLGSGMKREIVAAGTSPDKVQLLPNAVGEAFLQEPPAPAAARRRLGLPEDGMMIGTVSSLVDYEGIDDLLRAAATLRSDYPELRVLVAGDGTAAPGLRALAAELGLAQQVIFPGRVHRSTAATYHQALDIFVLPRKDLPVTRAVTPLKPVEALAAARPVVASDLPALREIVSDDESTGTATGLFFPPGDWAALAERLRELLRDGNRRALLGKAGRALVLAERTWEANARTVSDEYARLRK